MNLFLALILALSGLGSAAKDSLDCCACCPGCDPGCDCPACECCDG